MKWSKSGLVQWRSIPYVPMGTTWTNFDSREFRFLDSPDSIEKYPSPIPFSRFFPWNSWSMKGAPKNLKERKTEVEFQNANFLKWRIRVFNQFWLLSWTIWLLHNRTQTRTTENELIWNWNLIPDSNWNLPKWSQKCWKRIIILEDSKSDEDDRKPNRKLYRVELQFSTL